MFNVWLTFLEQRVKHFISFPLRTQHFRFMWENLEYYNRREILECIHSNIFIVQMNIWGPKRLKLHSLPLLLQKDISRNSLHPAYVINITSITHYLYSNRKECVSISLPWKWGHWRKDMYPHFLISGRCVYLHLSWYNY